MQVGEHFLAAQNVFQALKAFVGQNSDFVRKILFELRNLRRLDRLSALVLFLPFPGEDLYIDDHALDTRRAVERSIARSSFSSGVSCVSPLGVTLPTRISPCFTVAPMRITPASSKLRSIDSLTFGISRVTSSGPSLVSRDSISNSSMCSDV